MERILNDDEKIRRAEEIYYRRNGQNLGLVKKQEPKEKGGLKNRFLLHLLIMFNLAVLVFAIQNKEYIFTEEFLSQIKQYNVDISAKITEFLKDSEKEDGVEEKNNEATLDSSLENQETKSAEQQEELTQEQPVQEISSSMNEMQLDINNLKAAYSFIKPLEAVVSSGFGARESEYQNVTGYHTGVDLAAPKGTGIKASMEGIVTLVSNEGDYGKHIKIRCNNVTTLYAHCSEIFVKEGQIVAQGQEIGAVGNTGNSTGPHLHFEIRVDDRFVDPLQILSF